MKLTGWRFETVSDIQRKSQAIFDSIKENYFHGAIEEWGEGEDVIAACIPKEIILKGTAAKIKLSQHLFLDPVRELSDTSRT
jgi:hypothetical protein